MKNYQYLLFDWDGCLADTLPLNLESYQKVFAEYNLYPSTAEIVAKLTGDWQGAKKFGIEDVETFNQKYLKNLDEKYPFVSLYDGALAALRSFKKTGKKIALITTSYLQTIKPALKNTSVEGLLDLIVSADDPVKQKPNPEIIWFALKKLNAPKEQAIMIGDSHNDLGAASNAGIDSVLTYPPSHRLFYNLDQLKTYHPTFIVSDFQELQTLFTK